VSAPDPPLTSESAPRRSVKAANQPRWLDWFAGLELASCALTLLAYGIEFLTRSPLSSGAFVLLMPGLIAWALWLWVNRVHLELSPERIVIRSRWRWVTRAQPRDLVLPADAAIVAKGGLVRVGGWSAGTWRLDRVAAVAREAGVALDVQSQPTSLDAKRRLGAATGAGMVLAALVFVVGFIALVWGLKLSLSGYLEIMFSFAGLGGLLTVLVLLRLRFRIERAVPGDAIEPTRGRDHTVRSL
jgi:hypothetical protein